MTEYNPPIPTRETEELIAIANPTDNDWQQTAIELAKAELKRRGVTKEFQRHVLNVWKEEEIQSEIANQKQLKQNVTEGYSTGKMIYIFLVAPFLLIGKWSVELSLWELKRKNYKKKFNQRLMLLFAGTSFWISYIVLSTNDYEKKRLEEIKKIDISEWEKTYYGKDSLSR